MVNILDRKIKQEQNTIEEWQRKRYQYEQLLGALKLENEEEEKERIDQRLLDDTLKLMREAVDRLQAAVDRARFGQPQ
jgi:uncharacterized protein YhaN